MARSSREFYFWEFKIFVFRLLNSSSVKTPFCFNSNIFCKVSQNILLGKQACSTSSTNPVLSSWTKATGATGYGGSTADVTAISYNSTHAFISANSIPSYSIGPWANTTYVASSQSNVWMFPLSPSANTGSLSSTGMGNKTKDEC